MAKREEGQNNESETQPSQGGRGIDQGGPATEQERLRDESKQDAQRRRDVAGSNAPGGEEEEGQVGLPRKYNLSDEQRAERDGKSRAYIVAADGVSIRGKFYNRGDEVYLTNDEARRQREGGVPLTAAEHDDKPQDPSDVRVVA